MQGFSAGSKLGAFSASRLHSCAYIDEYFGSSRAFSKTYGGEKGVEDAKRKETVAFESLTKRITPLRTIVESNPTFNMSTVSFSNFSGVILLRIPRIWKVIKLDSSVQKNVCWQPTASNAFTLSNYDI